MRTAAEARAIPVRIVDGRRVVEVHRPVRPGQLAGDAWRAARQGRALAHRIGCDVVHFNGLKPQVVVAVARRSGPVPRRFVAHLHNIPCTPLERIIWRGAPSARRERHPARPLRAGFSGR